MQRAAVPTPHERGTSGVHARARRVVRHDTSKRKRPPPRHRRWGPAGQLHEIYVTNVRAAMPLLRSRAILWHHPHEAGDKTGHLGPPFRFRHVEPRAPHMVAWRV